MHVLPDDSELRDDRDAAAVLVVEFERRGRAVCRRGADEVAGSDTREVDLHRALLDRSEHPPADGPVGDVHAAAARLQGRRGEHRDADGQSDGADVIEHRGHDAGLDLPVLAVVLDPVVCRRAGMPSHGPGSVQRRCCRL
ncbi:hypothetical protein ABZZ80_40740 [Streptomyces sp. NPDC006356]